MVKIKNSRPKPQQELNENESDNEVLPLKRKSDEPIPAKKKWKNRQRVLVFAARGITFRHRHLMEDLKKLLPHSKSESKMEKRENLNVINEICEIKNCNKCIFFEGRKLMDLYVWFANVPTGPSIKFLVENIYTMGELKFTGNCLKGSRPLLSFDETFNSAPHYQLMKELITQIFGTPNHHPKSQPFFDHVFTFTVLDNKIWFRNFQILSEDGAITEIGPKMVLNPIKIFDDSFGGATIWENPFYVTPSKYRQQFNKIAGNKYVNRVQQKIISKSNKPTKSYKLNDIDEMFSWDLDSIPQHVISQKSKENSPKKKKKENQNAKIVSRVIDGKIAKIKKKIKKKATNST